MATTLTGVTLSHVAAQPHIMSGPPAAPTPATSGTWPIIPGVLWFTWEFDAAKDTADIECHLFFWTIDKLTGTLSSTNLSLADDLDLLGVAEGNISITMTYGHPGGITIKVNLTLFDRPVWNGSFPLITW